MRACKCTHHRELNKLEVNSLETLQKKNLTAIKNRIVAPNHQHIFDEEEVVSGANKKGKKLLNE